MHGKTQQFFHWFINAATGETVTTVETTGTLFDFESRKSVPMPDDLLALAEPYFIKFQISHHQGICKGRISKDQECAKRLTSAEAFQLSARFAVSL